MEQTRNQHGGILGTEKQITLVAVKQLGRIILSDFNFIFFYVEFKYNQSHITFALVIFPLKLTENKAKETKLK